MTEGVERVALLALAYHELWWNWSCVDPRTDGSEIVYDLETEWQDISLLTMFASSAMSELDWLIIRALDDPARLSPLVPEIEPWRAEAVVRALAAGDGWEAASVPAGIVLTAAERWGEVDETMEHWRALGITTTRAEVFETYVDAMEAGTGRSRDLIISDFRRRARDEGRGEGRHLVTVLARQASAVRPALDPTV
jgi:hypothetical protein